VNPITALIQQLQQGSTKALARCITYVENELQGYEEILTQLQFSKNVPVIGFTGPPGAGKSTLINQVIKQLIANNKRVGVLAIDPTSPFNYGSLLGDRLRMSEHFTNNNVFIRSLATRGSLGGLSAKTIEIVDVMRAFNFDYIIVETVGVGQSEVEIAGLADITILVLVPEAGDDIQALKAGVMEIADVFVINKADRDGALSYRKHIQGLLMLRHISAPLGKAENEQPPIINTVASTGKGIEELMNAITTHNFFQNNNKRAYLLTEKAFSLIQNHRMKNINKQELQNTITTMLQQETFNLYQFVQQITQNPDNIYTNE